MRFSIVIPTYNHCDDLLKPCIESIIKHTDLRDIELVVVANGCVDNTIPYLNYVASVFKLRGHEKNFVLVESDKPLGYSGACNAGIRACTADKIILLNNDTELLDQNKGSWIDLLDRPFSDPDCGISCIIKGHSEPAGRQFAVFFCVAIRRAVFDKIGLLNEEYGVGGGEDTEFCIEAEKAGFKVTEVFEKMWDGSRYVGGFPIYHKGEGTMHDPNLVKGWSDIFLENSLRLAKKYNPGWRENKLKELEDQRLKLSLGWLKENGPEAAELFDEVVVENIYQASKESLCGRPVIDIGANMGTFSVLAAALGATKVVAVEPVSKTFDVLMKNIERSKSQSIVVPQKAVVLDEPGKKVKIGVHEKSGHNSVYTDPGVFEEVSSVTLKSLLNEVDGNNVFLKMDCEGAEYDILFNADSSDMDRISTVAIEIHGDMHPKYHGFEVIEERLASFGFKMVDRKQIGVWDVDANGQMQNYRPLPRVNEIWAR